METIENFDFNELKISSDEIKEYDTGKPYPSYEPSTEGNLVLRIREVGQSLELMEKVVSFDLSLFKQ